MINFIYLALFWFANLATEHPFHVSVCDVVYKSDDKHLKISVRVFLDDMELTLRNRLSDPKLDIVDPNRWDEIQQITGDYLIETLKFSTTGKTLKLEYVGAEIDADVLWAYLEVNPLAPFSEMEVRFSGLFETYDDQENLVHVRNDGVVKSLRLNEKKPAGKLVWNKKE